MTARVGSAPYYIELFITLSAFYNVSWVEQGGVLSDSVMGGGPDTAH